jgi:hypothetical protein
MEAALRRRLDGVNEIVIDQAQQTADVSFARGDRVFSPAAFRGAVREAGVTVLGLRIDACGTIEQQASERWLRAGKTRFLVAEGETVPVGKGLCVSARLNDGGGEERLAITEVQRIEE